MRINFLSKSPILLFLLLLFPFIIILTGCHKTDFSQLHLTDKFFSFGSSLPKAVLRSIDELKRQNEITGFIDELARKDGYAYWDKAIINNRKNINPTFSKDDAVESGGDTLVFIPLVQENGNIVNGFLFFKINGSIETHLYRANDYDKFSYGKIDDLELTSEKVALMLMQLDKSIFGERKFDIADPNLFKSYTNQPQSIDSTPKTVEYKMGISYLEICYVSSVHCVAIGHCNGPNGTCDYCEQCADWTCVEIPIEGGDPGEPTGGWPPEPPTTTGPANGPIGMGGICTSCPIPGGNCTGNGNCVIGTQIIEGRVPCGNCGGGPIIVLPPEPPSNDPCTIAKNAAHKMDLLMQNANVSATIATIPNLSTESLEKGFGVRKTKSVDPNNPANFSFINYQCTNVQSGSNHHVDIDIPFNSYLDFAASFIHTHPPSGYAAQSPDDVYSLIKNSFDNQYLEGNIVHAYNGDEYAITITDASAATSFYNTKSQYLNPVTDNWNEDSDIGKSYNIALKYYLNLYQGNPNKSNLAYEMAMAAVLTEFNVGVTLNKKDANGNFKPLIINTSISDPLKPKKRAYTQTCT